MSPGLTARRQGLSVGSAMSSTTYAPGPAERVILVVTSCGHRCAAEGPRAAGASGVIDDAAVPVTRTENSTGASWGAILTSETAPPVPLPPPAGLESSATAVA